ncbi:MAG: FtsH protease activity modulator HflK [Candidatus Omnitrophica bacterium CG11_big_fil_rev_8_21_14_0_20_64_10]|nr:MAG: FtsH protease activity modulator HflK [Candidatus Omnitrophica bacterium CG11_big_fil_rev_8_21_14_0_20_64_10]
MADWDMKDLERLDEARRKMRQAAPRMIGTGLALLILGWLATGIYVVNPGEQGVIRQFGKWVSTTEAGFHYHLPWPIQQRDVVNLKEVRSAEIGFRSYSRYGENVVQRVPQEALMLTGDINIITAQVIVQYQIADPVKYLFRLRDPDENLRAATEVALRSAVGNATIDKVLTVGREQVQEETRGLLQMLLDDYRSGLLVREVKLQKVDPPDQVQDAFHEVVRAREDLEKLINQARGYREDLLPKARGEAQKMLRAAEAYQEERVLRAQGDSDRFLAVLEEYRKAPEVTRDRLYLESIGRILPRVQKVILSNQEGVMPFLSLPQAAAEAASARSAGSGLEEMEPVRLLRRGSAR